MGSVKIGAPVPEKAPGSAVTVKEGTPRIDEETGTWTQVWDAHIPTEEEIEESVRRDTTWGRPSWPLSGRTLLQAADDLEQWAKDFGLDGDETAKQARGDKEHKHAGFTGEAGIVVLGAQERAEG